MPESKFPDSGNAVMRKSKRKSRDLCEEYDVTPVTLWRWVQSGKLPKPDKINNRNYWPPDVKPKFDEEDA